MVEALLVFLVIILAMALTAGYFYFKQRLDKLELTISDLETEPTFDQPIKRVFEETTLIKPQETKNDIEKADPDSIDITPDNLHAIVTNKNIKIVREDVFSDADDQIM